MNNISSIGLGNSLALIYSRKRVVDHEIEELNNICRKCLSCSFSNDNNPDNNNNNNRDDQQNAAVSFFALPDGGVDSICTSVDCDIRFDRQRVLVLKEQFDLLADFLSAVGNERHVIDLSQFGQQNHSKNNTNNHTLNNNFFGRANTNNNNNSKKTPAELYFERKQKKNGEVVQLD